MLKPFGGEMCYNSPSAPRLEGKLNDQTNMQEMHPAVPSDDSRSEEGKIIHVIYLS